MAIHGARKELQCMRLTSLSLSLSMIRIEANRHLCLSPNRITFFTEASFLQLLEPKPKDTLHNGQPTRASLTFPNKEGQCPFAYIASILSFLRVGYCPPTGHACLRTSGHQKAFRGLCDLLLAGLSAGLSFKLPRSSAMKGTYSARKRNITFRYDISSSLVAAGIPSFPASLKQKKLMRLPHVFCRVLELPFNSEAPVLVEENEDCFRFIVNTDIVFQEVRAEVIEIVPGVTKVVVVGSNSVRIALDELELDLWRFRLPSSTLPELSSAIYSDGELIVTVPKDAANAPPEEEDKGTLVEAKEEDMGEGNGNPEGRMGSDKMGGLSESKNEEGSGRVKFEGHGFNESGIRLNHGMGRLIAKQASLMRPESSHGSLVTVQ